MPTPGRIPAPSTQRKGRGGSAAGRGGRGRPVVRRRDARAGAVGVHRDGQPAGHPARHERGEGHLHRTALSFVRYDDVLDWSGKPVKFVVGIAGAGKDYLPMLGQIARVFSDPDKITQLESAQTAEEVQAIVGQVSRPSARS